MIALILVGLSLGYILGGSEKQRFTPKPIIDMIAQFFKEIAITPIEVLRQQAIDVAEAYKEKTKDFEYKPIRVNKKTVILKRIK